MADLLAVIQFERNREAGTSRRLGFDPTIFVADAHRLADHDLPHRAALFDSAGRIDRFDECFRRPVATGHFGRVDPHLAVIDPHAGQRGQHVLDHLDANPVELERRPSRLIDPQSGTRPESARRRQYRAAQT